jgi:hypothetical protein
MTLEMILMSVGRSVLSDPRRILPAGRRDAALGGEPNGAAGVFTPPGEAEWLWRGRAVAAARRRVTAARQAERQRAARIEALLAAEEDGTLA